MNVRLKSNEPPPPSDTTGGEGAEARGTQEVPRRARILIVDDESMIVSALRRVLRNEYDVVGITDPAEALRTLTAENDFDVVLCDVLMPGMTGIELYDAVRERAPATAAKFIFSTGSVFGAQHQSTLQALPVPCLDKPVDLARLRSLLRDRLR